MTSSTCKIILNQNALLLNRESKSNAISIVVFLIARPSKVDPAWACFNNFFMKINFESRKASLPYPLRILFCDLEALHCFKKKEAILYYFQPLHYLIFSHKPVNRVSIMNFMCKRQSSNIYLLTCHSKNVFTHLLNFTLILICFEVLVHTCLEKKHKRN